ncbi:alpha/beta hydrolase [Pararhodobacter sp. SW119]|uniref:alpha/beta fold hydrolase n=1 Tax=Pararhodobacter sp. SW119 TaxID=2780075 RepID=UPI001ADF0F71|nr:alpha/beta hydrolase [Pararhodobacter sp. SW119]
MPFFAAADGARIHYTDRGQGTPLLCLAGLTRNASDFDYLAPHLSGVRMICMDYRGRGKSDWTGASTYTVAQEGDDALRLLDHLSLGAAPILGTSRGGIVGMFLCAIAPERVRGLCLNDVGPVLEPAGIDRIRDYIGRNPVARSMEEVAAALEATSHGFANVPPGRWLEEAQRHFVSTDSGLEINYDPALRDAFLAALDAQQGDAWPLFDAACGRPLAVIRGANSDLLSRATVEEMRRRCPDIILAEVPDRGHIPFLDEEQALGAIRAFLERIS